MKIGLKVVSTVTLVCFLTTQCVWGAPAAGIEMAAGRELPAYLSIDVPADLGTVDALYEAPAGASPQFILHIQNAHANYQAQMKIKQLLGYMNKKYGFKTIFVEGASEKLDADYLRLFPDRERNLKLCDELAKQGELTGAELFLMEQTTDSGNKELASQSGEQAAVEALGIEEASLYKANYEALKKVFGASADVARFFKGFDGRLDKVASKTFTPETRELIAEWKRFEQGRREFMPFVKGLASKSKKILKVDIESLFAQVGWPQISRLLVIQQMEKDLNKTKGVEEQAALIKMLRTKRVSKELLATLENFSEGSIAVGRSTTEVSPREVLERLAAEAGPQGFKFSDYPAFSLYAGFVTLRSELDPKTLFDEIEYLFTEMLDASAEKPDQKALLALYRDGELLRKLLHLELTRAQWRQAVEAKDRIGVPSLVARLKDVVIASGDTSVQKDQQVMPKAFSGKMDELFTAGFEFYDYAHKRESVFYKEMKTAMTEHKITKAILITGGFHTDGMSDLFRENAISYGIVTPRLSEKSDENLYQRMMLQDYKYPFEIANLEMIIRGAQSLLAVVRQGGRAVDYAASRIGAMMRMNVTFTEAGQTLNAFLNRLAEPETPRFAYATVNGRSEIRMVEPSSVTAPKIELTRDVLGPIQAVGGSLLDLNAVRPGAGVTETATRLPGRSEVRGKTAAFLLAIGLALANAVADPIEAVIQDFGKSGTNCFGALLINSTTNATVSVIVQSAPSVTSTNWTDVKTVYNGPLLTGSTATFAKWPAGTNAASFFRLKIVPRSEVRGKTAAFLLAIGLALANAVADPIEAVIQDFGKSGTNCFGALLINSTTNATVSVIVQSAPSVTSTNWADVKTVYNGPLLSGSTATFARWPAGTNNAASFYRLKIVPRSEARMPRWVFPAVLLAFLSGGIYFAEKEADLHERLMAPLTYRHKDPLTHLIDKFLAQKQPTRYEWERAFEDAQKPWGNSDRIEVFLKLFLRANSWEVAHNYNARQRFASLAKNLGYGGVSWPQAWDAMDEILRVKYGDGIFIQVGTPGPIDTILKDPAGRRAFYDARGDKKSMEAFVRGFLKENRYILKKDVPFDDWVAGFAPWYSAPDHADRSFEEFEGEINRFVGQGVLDQVPEIFPSGLYRRSELRRQDTTPLPEGMKDMGIKGGFQTFSILVSDLRSGMFVGDFLNLYQPFIHERTGLNATDFIELRVANVKGVTPKELLGIARVEAKQTLLVKYVARSEVRAMPKALPIKQLPVVIEAVRDAIRELSDNVNYLIPSLSNDGQQVEFRESTKPDVQPALVLAADRVIALKLDRDGSLYLSYLLTDGVGHVFAYQTIELPPDLQLKELATGEGAGWWNQMPAQYIVSVKDLPRTVLADANFHKLALFERVTSDIFNLALAVSGLIGLVTMIQVIELQLFSPGAVIWGVLASLVTGFPSFFLSRIGLRALWRALNRPPVAPREAAPITRDQIVRNVDQYKISWKDVLASEAFFTAQGYLGVSGRRDALTDPDFAFRLKLLQQQDLSLTGYLSDLKNELTDPFKLETLQRMIARAMLHKMGVLNLGLRVVSYVSPTLDGREVIVATMGEGLAGGQGEARLDYATVVADMGQFQGELSDLKAFLRQQSPDLMPEELKGKIESLSLPDARRWAALAQTYADIMTGWDGEQIFRGLTLGQLKETKILQKAGESVGAPAVRIDYPDQNPDLVAFRDGLFGAASLPDETPFRELLVNETNDANEAAYLLFLAIRASLVKLQKLSVDDPLSGLATYENSEGRKITLNFGETDQMWPILAQAMRDIAAFQQVAPRSGAGVLIADDRDMGMSAVNPFAIKWGVASGTPFLKPEFKNEFDQWLVRFNGELARQVPAQTTQRELENLLHTLVGIGGKYTNGGTILEGRIRRVVQLDPSDTARTLARLKQATAFLEAAARSEARMEGNEYNYDDFVRAIRENGIKRGDLKVRVTFQDATTRDMYYGYGDSPLAFSDVGSIDFYSADNASQDRIKKANVSKITVIGDYQGLSGKEKIVLPGYVFWLTDLGRAIAGLSDGDFNDPVVLLGMAQKISEDAKRYANAENWKSSGLASILSVISATVERRTDFNVESLVVGPRASYEAKILSRTQQVLGDPLFGGLLKTKEVVSHGESRPVVVEVNQGMLIAIIRIFITEARARTSYQGESSATRSEARLFTLDFEKSLTEALKEWPKQMTDDEAISRVVGFLEGFFRGRVDEPSSREDLTTIITRMHRNDLEAWVNDRAFYLTPHVPPNGVETRFPLFYSTKDGFVPGFTQNNKRTDRNTFSVVPGFLAALEYELMGLLFWDVNLFLPRKSAAQESEQGLTLKRESIEKILSALVREEGYKDVTTADGRRAIGKFLLKVARVVQAPAQTPAGLGAPRDMFNIATTINIQEALEREGFTDLKTEAGRRAAGEFLAKLAAEFEKPTRSEARNGKFTISDALSIVASGRGLLVDDGNGNRFTAKSAGNLSFELKARSVEGVAPAGDLIRIDGRTFNLTETAGIRTALIRLALGQESGPSAVQQLKNFVTSLKALQETDPETQRLLTNLQDRVSVPEYQPLFRILNFQSSVTSGDLGKVVYRIKKMNDRENSKELKLLFKLAGETQFLDENGAFRRSEARKILEPDARQQLIAQILRIVADAERDARERDERGERIGNILGVIGGYYNTVFTSVDPRDDLSQVVSVLPEDSPFRAQLAAIMNPEAEPRLGAKKRILVAEDEESMLELYLLILGQRGYEVVGVSDGREAWEELEAANVAGGVPFDLLITDGTMPGMDGRELLEKAKTYPNMKRLLISGGIPGVDDLATLGESYLNKPVERDVFLARVESLVTPRSELRSAVAARQVFAKNVEKILAGNPEVLAWLKQNRPKSGTGSLANVLWGILTPADAEQLGEKKVAEILVAYVGSMVRGKLSMEKFLANIKPIIEGQAALQVSSKSALLIKEVNKIPGDAELAALTIQLAMNTGQRVLFVLNEGLKGDVSAWKNFESAISNIEKILDAGNKLIGKRISFETAKVKDMDGTANRSASAFKAGAQPGDYVAILVAESARAKSLAANAATYGAVIDVSDQNREGLEAAQNLAGMKASQSNLKSSMDPAAELTKEFPDVFKKRGSYFVMDNNALLAVARLLSDIMARAAVSVAA